ncbi:MAG: iron-sulfur cluster insertion protein ErpA [Rhodospirillales bacterium]|jgi:iron-sulfur cluster insertion protein|nr:iron-sulfur cluster insertion protein ErpA [Rhodospirillales bacterium]
MPDAHDTPSEDAISLTPGAAQRICELRKSEGNDALMLRLTVSGGGCSGFQYAFSLDDTAADDDAVFERDGVKLVVDSMTLGMMTGSKVDFVEDLVGSYFSITNPHATSQCGCGASFAI